jgi:KamA family protein
MQPKIKYYGLHNFKTIPQLSVLSDEDILAIEVVGSVFPFKVNSYTIEKLINWDDAPNDPIFKLTFPTKGMLKSEHFDAVAELLGRKDAKSDLKKVIESIRSECNPHPAGQMELNIPSLNGKPVPGLQHKYKETVLFFPSEGQSCHSFCTYCFRWPQFGEDESLKIRATEPDLLIAYLHEHPEITDILITGGDPLSMSTARLASYIQPILAENPPHIKTIRIGTKSLTYWPYRFLNDPDTDSLLQLFKQITRHGIHLAIMAHFNHANELRTDEVVEAIHRIRATGAIIRTQSPIIRGINDDGMIWASLWRRQVQLGLIPYYMFIARDTGAQHHFGVSLIRAWEIFQEAYQNVSGIARTVRGPSMSTNPGKVQVLGTTTVNGEKKIVLQFLQSRDPDWVLRPFFAEYDPEAYWLEDLKPAFEEEFFFEQPLQVMSLKGQNN